MRQVCAVDPTNPSGSWTGSLSSSEFAVQHFDPISNLVLGLDGKLPNARNNILLVFGTIAEAEDYSAKKIESSPAIGCLIYNSRGRLVRSIRAPTARPRPPGAREILWGALFLLGGGLLLYFDIRAELTLIIGVLIGGRLIFAGISYLSRGIGGAIKRRGGSADG